jgi:hypothetical protein
VTADGAIASSSALSEVLVDKRRKIESESEARRYLAAVKTSGLPLKEWARARGIDGRSLHAWKMNLDRWSSAKTPRRARIATTRSSRPQLVELVASSGASGSRYALRIGSASVEFGDDFEAATLRRVIDLLRTC